MTKEELSKIQAYLRKTFGQKKLVVKGRPNMEDSAEVFIGDEFIGILFRDEEDDELSYQFQMAILDFDLEGV